MSELYPLYSTCLKSSGAREKLGGDDWIWRELVKVAETFFYFIFFFLGVG